MELINLDRITVLGAGVMGQGIALTAALAGFKVTVRDIQQEYLDKGATEIAKSLATLVFRGRMTAEASTQVLARITMTLDLAEAVKNADAIIEAIPENLDLKHAMWKEVSKNARSDALLTTNTSSISITRIAESVQHPERFVGMHFFNPPGVMRLVEIIPGAMTSAETLELTNSLAVKMGKSPVWVKKDSPGFIVNRILVTYINESAKLLDSGKWRKEQIDSAMQFKAKMPMGPLMLADLIGLDIVYSIMKVFEDALGPHYKSADSIVKLNAEKKLGRKTGEGYYAYKEQLRLSEADAFGFPVNILLDPLITEADKVVAEGVADPDAVDIALRLGANLPGGPFEMNRLFTTHRFNDYLEVSKVMGTKCRSCSKLSLPPRPICPECGSSDLEWKQYSGGGTLRAVTVISVPLSSMKTQSPYAMGVVQLTDGPSISGLLLSINEGEQAKVGDKVHAEFVKEGNKTRLCFKLD